MAETWLEKGLQLLKKHWGFSSFKPGQEEAIESVMNGTDTLVLFPTGGGKSICYQLPALLLDGLTVVISPLISLMEDQVNRLEAQGISATFLNSSLPSWEVEQRLVNARNGMYRLLYCSPERLETPLWQHELENLNIALIAVDEAHCISEWGHDFRKSYRSIRSSLESLSQDTRWIALTATATPEVRDDILNQLEFREPNVIVQGFDRPNLVWWVLETEKKDTKIGEMVSKAGEKGGLIYAGTRRKCDELASYLQHLGSDALPYHAGLDFSTRHDLQRRWQENQLHWVVATSAFGMGIDKPDCRYVFHYEMPQSLEAYYQQAGRAGRDGKKAYPVLLNRESDYNRIRKMIMANYPEKNELQKIYNALCDSMEVAVNGTVQDLFPVDYKDLARRNGLPAKKQMYGLKVLDRYGLIRIIENYKPRIGIRFALGQESILKVIREVKNQQKSGFIDQLIRIFGPESFSEYHYMDYDYLVEKLNLTPNSIVKGLEVLRREQILDYLNEADMTLVALVEARYDKLPYSSKELERHRLILLKKLDYMRGYVQTRNCRNTYIRRYFGEKNVRPCGVCDNCVARGKKADKGNPGLRKVITLLQKGPSDLRQIKKKTGLPAEQLKSVLRLLLREKKVETLPGKPDFFQISQNGD